ncbi:MAG: hypothetical protein ACK45R_08660 [Candidatus Kapaibacterium sp.]
MSSRIIVLALLFVFAGATAFAQKGDASPLGPDQFFERAGGYISFGGIRQTGSFSVDCPCQDFSGGGGAEFAIGGLYEYFPVDGLKWGINAGFQYRSMDARYVLREDTTLRSLDGMSSFSNVAIPFRHTSNISVQSFTVAPYLKHFLARTLFVRLGASAQIIVGASKNFHKVLLTNTVTLPNDDVVSIGLDRAALEAAGKRLIGENEVVIQEGSMSDVSAFQLSLQPAVGFQWQVSKRIFLVPMFEYSLPLTSVSSVDTGLRMNAFRGVVEIHVDF